MSNSNVFASVRSFLNTPIQAKQVREILRTPIPGVGKAPKRKIRRSSATSKKEPIPSQLIGALAQGKETPFSVNGRDFKISSETWIIGELRVGAAVKIKLAPASDGGYVATMVRVGVSG